MFPHRREAGSTGRLTPTDWGSSALSVTVCVSVRLSVPLSPRRQVPIPFLTQWNPSGSGRLVFDPFTSWGPMETAGCRDVRGVMQRTTPAPLDSRHQTAPAAGWGDMGGRRCPFPVGGQRARVARRPFRRVTAAESRWLTHPGRPSLPGPERPRPGQPREREMPQAVPRSRNWGPWATGPAELGRGHRCLDLPGLVARFPEDRAPTPRAQPQGLNPVLLPKH